MHDNDKLGCNVCNILGWPVSAGSRHSRLMPILGKHLKSSR